MKQLIFIFISLIVILTNSCSDSNKKIEEQAKEIKTIKSVQENTIGNLIDTVLINKLTTQENIIAPTKVLNNSNYYNKLIHLFDEIKKPVQKFSINNQTDTVIFCNSGTILTIPKNIFCDRNGKLTSTIYLELVEAYTIFDIITNSLSTTCNGNVLETDGMVSINAKSKTNDNLQIIKGKNIFLETPSYNSIPDIDIFYGKINENQTVNWEKSKSSDKYLTVIPLKYLNFYPSQPSSNDFKNIVKEKVKNNRVAKEISLNETNKYCGISKELINSIYNQQFENTLISTKEFELRMIYVHQSCSEDLFKMYLTNIDLNLWELDSLAVDLLEKQKNKLANTFQLFKNQKKTKVKDNNIKDPIFATFLSKNFDTYERNKKQNKLKNLTTNSFSITNLGWINCDRFLSDPKSVPLKLEIIATNIDSLQICKTYLIFNSINSILDLSRYRNGTFYVGNNGSMILPKGEKVQIVSISNDGESTLLEIQNITIGDDENIKINLKPVTPDFFAKTLKGLNKSTNPILLKVVEENNCCVESVYKSNMD